MVTLALGEMDAARVNPYRFDQGIPGSCGLVRTPTVSGGHPIPGGGGRHQVCQFPVGDVHPPDYIGHRGNGWRLERPNRWIRVKIFGLLHVDLRGQVSDLKYTYGFRE